MIVGVVIGIRAFHLRGRFQTGRFDEFFRLGSRFVAGTGYAIRQVLARSTRVNSRLPGGTEHQDISRRVHIAVVPCATFGTGPFPHLQRHLVHNILAFRTGLAGWRKPASNPQLAAIPRRLVFQLPPELPHADIGDGTGQVMILDHALDVQVLDGDDIGALDDGGGGLVQEIRATGGDSGVNPRNLDPLPIPPVAALSHPRQPPLLALEVSQAAFQVARIAGLPAVAIDDHILDAQVQANRIAGGWQGLNLDLARKRHEVAPVRRFADRRHFRDSGRYLRPAHLERAQLGELEKFTGFVGALDLPLIQLIPNRLSVVSGFEPGIPPALLKKALVRLVLIDQRLSQAARGGIRQPGEFATLPFRYEAIERHVVVPGLVGLVRLASQVQAAVPHKPRVPEFHRQLLALDGVRVETIFVGALGYHVAYCTDILSTNQR